MYTLKPYYDSDAPVKLPDCMYKLSNYHGNQNPLTTASVASVDTAILKQLEDRQENILKKLEQLKAEVDKLTGSTRSSEQSEASGLVDVVISAHPAAPPYALLALQRLLAQQRKVLASCHRHSSARDVTEKHMDVFGNSNGGVTTDRNLYDIVFTLIWKDVEYGPHMMVSPRTQTCIQGEGSIARYLARLLTPSYDNGDIVTATEIDQWVDSAMQYTRGNAKERASVLKAVNAKLGKSEWVVGNELTLADVMLWGVLSHDGGGANAPSNVKKWYETCSGLDVFQGILIK